METIFMNSQNSQTSKPHSLILKFTDKLDLRKGENRIALSNISIYYTWKNIKSSYHHNETINLNYLMGHILYQIFKITLNTFKKNIEKILIIYQS